MIFISMHAVISLKIVAKETDWFKAANEGGGRRLGFFPRRSRAFPPSHGQASRLLKAACQSVNLTVTTLVELKKPLD
jgi:hypothetical protein